MKKITTLVFCLVMVMSFVACGGPESADEAGDTDMQITITEGTREPTGTVEDSEREENSESAETAEDATREENKNPEDAADHNGTIAVPDGLVKVNVTIAGVPDEWKMGAAEEVNSIQDDTYIGTTYKDTNAVVSGYFFFVGVDASEEDYNKLLAYFETNEYTDCSKEELPSCHETVYTCEWGNCHVRYIGEIGTIRVSWWTFSNT